MDDSPAPQAPHSAARLLAFLLPVTVAACWFGYMVQPTDRGALHASVDDFDRRMASSDASVVMLGNSLARRAIDMKRLGAALGRPDGAVSLVIDGSDGATWYAVAKHRIFEAGHRPDLLVVPTVPAFALKLGPDSPRVQAIMADHLPADDDEVLPRTLGAGWSPWWWQRIDRRRADVRSAVLDLPRRVGGADVDAALTRVFDADGAVDMRLHARAMPIVEMEVTADGPRAQTMEDSFVPDLIGLAESHGARVLFIQVPVQAGWKRPALPPALQKTFIEGINGAPNAGYIDLSALALPPNGFADHVHLSGRGQVLFMDALEPLLDPGFLGETELPDAQVPIQASDVRRVGSWEPPPWEGDVQSTASCCSTRLAPLAPLNDLRLSSLGIGAVSPLRVKVGGRTLSRAANKNERETCAGTANHLGTRMVVCGADATDAILHVEEALPWQAHGEPTPQWWVPPGTSIEVDLPALDGTAEVELVWVRVMGEAPGVAAIRPGTLRTRRTGWVERAKGPLTPGSDTTLTLEAPADTWLFLRAIVVRREGATLPVVGDAARLANPPALLTSGSVQIASGSVEGARTVKLGVPDVPAEGLVRWPSPYLASMSDEALTGHHRGERSCNPLELRVGGELVEGVNTTPKQLRAGDFGYVMDAEGVLARLPAGVSPSEVQASLRWEPGTCRGWSWVHGGTTWSTTLERADHLLAGVAAVELLGSVHGTLKRVTATLSVAGKVHETLELPLGQIGEEPVRLKLRRPIEASAQSLEVQVRAEGRGSVRFVSFDLLPPESWAKPPGKASKGKAPAAKSTPPKPARAPSGNIPLSPVPTLPMGRWPESGMALRGASALPTITGGKVVRAAVDEPTTALLCTPLQEVDGSATLTMDASWKRRTGREAGPDVVVTWRDGETPLMDGDGKVRKRVFLLDVLKDGVELKAPDDANTASVCVRFMAMTGDLTLRKVGWR